MIRQLTGLALVALALSATPAVARHHGLNGGLGRLHCTATCELNPRYHRQQNHGVIVHQRRHYINSVGALTPVLGRKVTEIVRACHSRLISGYRPGARVAGSGHPSLHSVYPSKAADLSGDPSCIYSHLKGWQGGYSVDYAIVKHVHVSYSPPGSGYLARREWHARFYHYGSHHRYARRHRHQLAYR